MFYLIRKKKCESRVKYIKYKQKDKKKYYENLKKKLNSSQISIGIGSKSKRMYTYWVRYRNGLRLNGKWVGPKCDFHGQLAVIRADA